MKKNIERNIEEKSYSSTTTTEEKTENIKYFIRVFDRNCIFIQTIFSYDFFSMYFITLNLLLNKTEVIYKKY